MGKSSINEPFSMAMLNNQMVDRFGKFKLIYNPCATHVADNIKTYMTGSCRRGSHVGVHIPAPWFAYG